MGYFTYILASRPLGALYVGSTKGLRRRVAQHQRGAGGPHTAKYRIKRLVWFEEHDSYPAAARRERQIKGWRRVWKDQLIMTENPDWQDLSWQIPD